MPAISTGAQVSLHAAFMMDYSGQCLRYQTQALHKIYLGLATSPMGLCKLLALPPVIKVLPRRPNTLTDVFT